MFPDTLSIMRKKAVEAFVLDSLSVQKVCKLFEFSRVLLWRYLKEYRKNQSFEYKKRGVKPRTEGKMMQIQEDELVSSVLSYTSDEIVMDYMLWNSKVIKNLIESKYYS